MKGRRLILWGALGVLVVAGLVYAFRPQPVPVDLVEAVRGSLVVTLDEEGETRVRDVFVVSAPITGRSLRIEADVGDAVTAGRTIVAEIEPIDPSFLDLRTETQARAAIQAAEAALTLAEAELEEAQAELDFADADLKRARRLIVNETISERAVDEAERAFRTRRAAVATAEAALKMRTFELEEAKAELLSPLQAQERRDACECVPIAAPVSGRVLRVIQESEGVVEAGDPLLEIGDPTDLEIVADYLSADAVRIEAGQTVMIEAWGGEAELAGRVRRVEPFGFTKESALGIEEQRVNVIIDFTDPPAAWQRLGHGYRIEARVVLSAGENVLKLPLTALFRNNGSWAVFVKQDGRAQQRTVQRGTSNGLEAEIVDGLAEGDRVVLYPSNRVTDGVRIAQRQ